MSRRLVRPLDQALISAEQGDYVQETGALPAYVARYVAAFGADALTGLRVGVYEHSSVARDALAEALAQHGGRGGAAGPRRSFHPGRYRGGGCGHPRHARSAGVPSTRLMRWCRPMAMRTGRWWWMPVARWCPAMCWGRWWRRSLGADVICTPVSSNTLVDQLGFGSVIRTKIGSPLRDRRNGRGGGQGCGLRGQWRVPAGVRGARRQRGQSRR